jgi:hypothetical protein
MNPLCLFLNNIQCRFFDFPEPSNYENLRPSEPKSFYSLHCFYSEEGRSIFALLLPFSLPSQSCSSSSVEERKNGGEEKGKVFFLARFHL